jgi:hypothetical protein
VACPSLTDAFLPLQVSEEVRNALSIPPDTPLLAYGRHLIVRATLSSGGFSVETVKNALAKFKPIELLALIDRLGLKVRPLHRAVRHLVQRERSPVLLVPSLAAHPVRVRQSRGDGRPHHG